MDKLRFGQVELWGTVHQSTLRRDGRQVPALELRLEGGVDETALAAMQSCPLEILDGTEQVQGTHSGYTQLVRHSVLLAKTDEAQQLAEMQQRCAALEQENAALREMQNGGDAN